MPADPCKFLSLYVARPAGPWSEQRTRRILSNMNYNLKAKEILTFVPSGPHYDLAIRFYQEIGFHLDWKSDSEAILNMDGCRFFLQNLTHNWGKGNFKMVLEVENLDDWWSVLNRLDLEKRYPEVKMKPPTDYPWGKREIHLVDPCNVLWHISVKTKKVPAAD